MVDALSGPRTRAQRERAALGPHAAVPHKHIRGTTPSSSTGEEEAPTEAPKVNDPPPTPEPPIPPEPLGEAEPQEPPSPSPAKPAATAPAAEGQGTVPPTRSSASDPVATSAPLQRLSVYLAEGWARRCGLDHRGQEALDWWEGMEEEVRERIERRFVPGRSAPEPPTEARSRATRAPAYAGEDDPA